MEFNFTITPRPLIDQVDIKWTFELKKGNPAWEGLYYVLSGTRGVEYVDLDRYSARVRWASHVVTCEGLVAELKEELETNNDFKWALGQPRNDEIEVKVTVTR